MEVIRCSVKANETHENDEAERVALLRTCQVLASSRKALVVGLLHFQLLYNAVHTANLFPDKMSNHLSKNPYAERRVEENVFNVRSVS